MFTGRTISFKEKLRLADAAPTLTRLGSGSARVVFGVDLTTGTRRGPSVMKIAKNTKGLRQNLAEAQLYVKYNSYPPYMTPMVSWDDNDDCDTAWISVMKAGAYSETAFWNHFGVPFKTFSDCLSEQINHSRMNPRVTTQAVKDFIRWVEQNDLMLGEFRQGSNWGTYNGMPVILDAGLTHANYAIAV